MTRLSTIIFNNLRIIFEDSWIGLTFNTLFPRVIWNWCCNMSGCVHRYTRWCTWVIDWWKFRELCKKPGSIGWRYFGILVYYWKQYNLLLFCYIYGTRWDLGYTNTVESCVISYVEWHELLIAYIQWALYTSSIWTQGCDIHIFGWPGSGQY